MFTYTIRTDQDSAGVWHATCWREGWRSPTGPVVGRGLGTHETIAVSESVEDFSDAYATATGKKPGE